MVILQIEHIDAVNSIDRMLAVPGITSLVIGSNDLSGSMGLLGQPRHPKVLEALDPRHAVRFMMHHAGVAGLLVLGGVFLSITGGEALYADMGHFGRWPIRVAWTALVLPSLVLNYAGQTALVLSGSNQ